MQALNCLLNLVKFQANYGLGVLRLEVNINDISNYKNCSKKLYSIYVCKPPKNTVVINQLEQADIVRMLNGKTFFSTEEIERMQTSNPSKLMQLQQLVSQGKAYAVTDNTPFVLCGTVGELWTISADKLAKTYMFLQNGQPVTINSQTLSAKMKDDCFDWTVVRTSPQATAGQNMACFIPRGQSGQLQTAWGAVLTYNGAGAFHGRGDFIVCAKLPNGKPNLSDRWVVNGEIFATTYNNQGWVDCLSNKPPKQFTIVDLPRLVPIAKKDDQYQGIFDKLCQSLDWLKAHCVGQMPFRYRRTAEDIQVVPAVIEDYSNKANLVNSENKDLSVAERTARFSHFVTVISAVKDTLQFKSYNVFAGRKELVYAFEIPANDAGVAEFNQNIEIYGGLLGWIPNGVQNCFTFLGCPTKYEHDGIHAYTVSSSGINRKLRLQDAKDRRAEERMGDESQRLYRAIDGADRYFDKVQITRPLTVYRGMPGRDAVTFSDRNSLEDLTGGLITNTAYTSSTLNLHSSLMFSKTASDPNNGVILVIDLPAGTHADYIHNIAGWKEQFEVLWDRKYDIRVKNKLLSFKGGANFTYHVFRAEIVSHAPFSPIPSAIGTFDHLNVPGIDKYDKNGRINFDYRAVKGILSEAFDVLKKKGIAGVQWQSRLQFDPFNRDYIVVHAGEGDDDTVVDLGFTYNTDTRMIDVIKFTSKKRISHKDANGNDVTSTARNYWSDWNRNNGAIDQNFYWESYNGNDNAFNVNNFSFSPKSSITVKSPNNTGIDEHNLSSCVAFTILEYVKYNKDVTLLPMQDVARYLDSVFKNTIIDEGYRLRDFTPVNRVGKADDENDGYVPLAFRIDGDNDDTLTIKMRMYRDDKGKLQLEYRGASANNRVKQADKLHWNIFNQEIMERECNKILYVFASKLNLNHTRKADKLMEYVSRNRGFVVTGANENSLTKDERNIHEKGNHKLYRLWYPNKRDNIKVTLDVKDGVYDFYLCDNKHRSSSFKIDSKLPVFELYRAFIDSMNEMG